MRPIDTFRGGDTLADAAIKSLTSPTLADTFKMAQCVAEDLATNIKDYQSLVGVRFTTIEIVTVLEIVRDALLKRDL